MNDNKSEKDKLVDDINELYARYEKPVYMGDCLAQERASKVANAIKSIILDETAVLRKMKELYYKS